MNVGFNDSFFADASGFASDLDDGTLSVTVLNPSGTTYRAAQTTNIKEQGTSTGCYRAVIPGLPHGTYVLKWNDGSGGIAYEPVYVINIETPPMAEVV